MKLNRELNYELIDRLMPVMAEYDAADIIAALTNLLTITILDETDGSLEAVKKFYSAAAMSASLACEESKSASH